MSTSQFLAFHSCGSATQAYTQPVGSLRPLLKRFAAPKRPDEAGL